MGKSIRKNKNIKKTTKNQKKNGKIQYGTEKHRKHK